MPICKFCGIPFGWGRDGEKFVPLVPIEDHDDLPRTHLDEHGVLRAAHSLICTRVGGETVNVTKLAEQVMPENIIHGRAPEPEVRRRRRRE